MSNEDNQLLWHLVDGIDSSLKAEARSLSGKELVELAEVTDAKFRTAWEVIRQALPARGA